MNSKLVITEAVLDMETMEIVSTTGFQYDGPWALAEGDNSGGSGTPGGEGEGNDGSSDGQGGDEQPFLKIDDRTTYRTSDEAVRGYQEAGRRIAELTPWQQIASDYGLRDPRDISALLDELIELRAGASTRTNAQGDGTRSNTQGASGAGAGAEAAVDPKQKEALEWLKVNGVKAGYITEDQAKELRDRLDQFQEFASSVENERFSSRINEGRGYLKEELDAQGIKFPDKKTEDGFHTLLENALTTWVNADDRRIASFHQGGDSERALIKEGLTEVVPLLNVLKNQQAANYAANKNNTKTQARIVTKPAQQQQAQQRTKTGVQPPPKKNRMDTGEDLTPETHDAAWAALQAAMGHGATA